MDLASEEKNASVRAHTHISELTGAKVRIFLSEVAEGVSNYRSMHSLTQQVEHQYHGRFLIELVQNAHDAFPEQLCSNGNRIEIVFDLKDSLHGSLLVANDGHPFSPSNFERLSQLGQSDKDPQKSIGNKGIGFRSVLEISDCPQVYSRSTLGSTSFDGYCFAFRPDVVKSLVAPITQLSKGGPVPVWPNSGELIVDSWSDEMLRKFRKRVQSNGEDWLIEETRFLSPYLLPVPLSKIESAQVANFESRSFSTVVRLPLKSAELQSYVLERMQQLSNSTVLFLDKVGTLCITSTEHEKRTFTRTSEPLAQGLGGTRVAIADSGDIQQEYGIWKRALHVPSAPEAFRKAVTALPGRWPEITDISVSVAVRLGNEPDAGRFSIYLPTLVPTGSAVHINAPFFGDMSRTSIPFDDAYNKYLLETATDLSLEIVRGKLAGKGEIEACAILDFLAPLGSGPATERWAGLIAEAESRASASLVEEPLVLAEGGWQPINLTSLVPTPPTVKLLTEEVLRRHATFQIFHKCLNSRSAQIEKLAATWFSESGAYPLKSELAGTVAAVASELHASGGDWNAFWHDVAVLLPNGQTELSEYAVLLGSDGALHRSGERTKVFFVPRQGTQDDSEVGGDVQTAEVPTTLRSSVAFLSDQVQLYDPNRLTMQTPVRIYLGQGLVSQFRVDTIFSEVLQQLTPTLPATIEGEHTESCRDILKWAMRLMGNIVGRGRGADSTLKLLRTIPVPCEGGWFPMWEASFSEGWPGTTGSTLKAYLKKLKSSTADAARKRLLLPPEHPAWGDIGTEEVQLLIAGGVVNGLRLFETKTESWPSRFRASMYEFQLPGPPPNVGKEHWVEFAASAQAQVKVPFTTLQPYEVGSILFFPGMAEFKTLEEDALQTLSELVLHSITKWQLGWQTLTLTKQGGQGNRLELTSPLGYFLKSVPWLAIKDSKGDITWALPSERWFVPADTLVGRARHYAHLRALPTTMARDIAQYPDLAGVLRMLGMRFFDPHAVTTDSSLLEALTTAVGSDEVADANVLLGQLRDAWQRFRPPADRPPIELLAVRRRDKKLSTITPTIELPAFLPDLGTYVAELEEFDFPVVTIGPSDAKDLREWFTAAYGARIQLTSSLSLAPHVNEAEWTGKDAFPLADSDLGWLVRPLLVLAAQGRGVHSVAFKERVETLRSARIHWVPNLSVAVMRGETRLATTQLAAHWEPTHKTLVVTEHCRTHLEDLSGALAQALERDDLKLPLRYLLRPIGTVESVPDDIAEFLAPLDISPEQVHQVIEHLRGDVGHICRLVSLFATVLLLEADLARLQDASTEEELASALQALGWTDIDVGRTLEFARNCQDTFEFGRAVSQSFGNAASLARWNEELVRLDQSRLANRNWGLQLQSRLEEATALIKRVIAHVIRLGSERTYEEMCSQYHGLIGTVDLSHTHWTVSFNDAMFLVAGLVESWLGNSEISLVLRSAESPEDLRERLLEAGLQLDVDPDECGRKNHALVDSVARGMDRISLSVWLKTAAEKASHDWSPLVDQYRLAAVPALVANAFTRDWSEAYVFALLRDTVPHLLMPKFQTALDASMDLESLQLACGLSSEDLLNAQGRLDSIKAERNRRRSLVKVCGEDFDSSVDNLDQLWVFLSARITDAELVNAMPLNLAKAAPLAPIKVKVRTDEGTPRALSRQPTRQPRAIEDLIGLAGEIYVFRILRQQYGSDAVSSSAWVSENSLHVYEFNQANDALGCDFQFTAKGKQFRVEVKASMGDDETFTLGSSEIRLAMDIATKGKRKKEVFVLVHVKNVLSLQPTAVVLPNPYDPKNTGMFRVEEADARVRYRTRP